MLRRSCSKVSGNPADFPSHSLPARADSGTLRLVGPVGMGVLEEGVFSPPEAYEEEVKAVLSVGKSVGS